MTLKTTPNAQTVEAFIDGMADPQMRADCLALITMMEQITGSKSQLWGDSLVGFGTYHYRYESGREGDWFLTGFSPRKQNLSIYLMAGFEKLEDQLATLGKHKTGKGCLYVRQLADVDLQVLRQMIEASVQFLKERYPDPMN